MSNHVKALLIGSPGVGKRLILRNLREFNPETSTLKEQATDGDVQDEKSMLARSALHVIVNDGVKDRGLTVLAIIGKHGQFQLEDFTEIKMANVILLAFAVDDATSLQALQKTYYPGLQRILPNVKVVLVGTKSDTRLNTTESEGGFVPVGKAEKAAEEFGGARYIEMSALSGGEGLREVLEAVVDAGTIPLADAKWHGLPVKKEESSCVIC